MFFICQAIIIPKSINLAISSTVILQWGVVENIISPDSFSAGLM